MIFGTHCALARPILKLAALVNPNLCTSCAGLRSLAQANGDGSNKKGCKTNLARFLLTCIANKQKFVGFLIQ